MKSYFIVRPFHRSFVFARDVGARRSLPSRMEPTGNFFVSFSYHVYDKYGIMLTISSWRARVIPYAASTSHLPSSLSLIFYPTTTTTVPIHSTEQSNSGRGDPGGHEAVGRVSTAERGETKTTPTTKTNELSPVTVQDFPPEIRVWANSRHRSPGRRGGTDVRERTQRAYASQAPSITRGPIVKGDVKYTRVDVPSKIRRRCLTSNQRPHSRTSRQ